MNFLLSVVGSVVFCLVMRCVSAAFGLPHEDLVCGALAYLAIYAIITAREGGSK